MIKRIVGLVVIALIGWVVYVTFMGTPEDRELRDKLFNSSSELAKDVASIFSHESEKFKEGTYDEALDKLSNAIDGLKEANDGSKDYTERLAALQEEKERLKKQIASGGGTAARQPVSDDEKNGQDISKLADEISKLADEMKKGSK